MAKVVIAGASNCPYFAKVELLGDRLVKNLPNFQLHKIVKTPEEWESWVSKVCEERGWNHKTSPLVWRELIDRGGKGVLIGGASDFQEYVKGYYGLESELKSQDMRLNSEENFKTKKDVDEEDAYYRSLSKPLHVCLTAAGSPTCYALISSIASGEVFGRKTEITLRLLDVPGTDASLLEGVAMETQDICCGLVRDIQVFTDPKLAFKDCSVIVLMDELLQEEEEDFDDWICRNHDFFVKYAKIINEVAKKNVRVLVAGEGPVNFNAMMMIKNAPNINRHNIVAASRLVENRAKSVLAQRLNVNTAGIVDLIIWGNVSGKHYIDVSKSRVHGYDGAVWGPPWYSLPAVEMVHDNKWLEKEYLELVAQRKSTVEAAVGHMAAGSSARAIATTLTHWWQGSPLGQMFSLAICSDGWYGVPEDMVFSYPVTMSPSGYFSIVEDMELTDEIMQKIKETVKDLQREIEVIYPPPKPPTPPPPPQPEPAAEEPAAEEAVQEEQKPEEEKVEGEEEAKEEEAKEGEEKAGEEVKEEPTAEAEKEES